MRSSPISPKGLQNPESVSTTGARVFRVRVSVCEPPLFHLARNPTSPFLRLPHKSRLSIIEGGEAPIGTYPVAHCRPGFQLQVFQLHPPPGARNSNAKVPPGPHWPQPPFLRAPAQLLPQTCPAKKRQQGWRTLNNNKHLLEAMAPLLPLRCAPPKSRLGPRRSARLPSVTSPTL